MNQKANIKLLGAVLAVIFACALLAFGINEALNFYVYGGYLKPNGDKAAEYLESMLAGSTRINGKQIGLKDGYVAHQRGGVVCKWYFAYGPSCQFVRSIPRWHRLSKQIDAAANRLEPAPVKESDYLTSKID